MDGEDGTGKHWRVDIDTLVLSFFVLMCHLQPFIAWIEEVMSDSTPVTVHSISYDEAEYHVPQKLLELFSISAQKLGLMGTSIIVR